MTTITKRFELNLFSSLFAATHTLMITVALCLLGSGCAADKFQHYASVEQDNAAKHSSVPAGKSVVYVLYQEPPVIYNSWIIAGIDGIGVATLGPNTYYMAVLAPGRHEVGVVSDGEFFGKVLGMKVPLDAKPDQTYFFKTSYDRNVPIIGPISVAIQLDAIKEESGKKLLEKYRLVTP
jgi:hypothetical protein